jgi:hypothetical protein
MLVTSEKPGKAFEQKKILTTKISSLRHFSHIAGLPEPNTCLLPENNAVLEKKPGVNPNMLWLTRPFRESFRLFPGKSMRTGASLGSRTPWHPACSRRETSRIVQIHEPMPPHMPHRGREPHPPCPSQDAAGRSHAAPSFSGHVLATAGLDTYPGFSRSILGWTPYLTPTVRSLSSISQA